jgi:DNA polymerase-1
MPITLLLDADIIAYKFAAANERKYDFGDGDVCRTSDLPKALNDAREYIADMREQLGAAEVIICLSDPTGNYFRKEFFPAYKANRKGVVKPEHLKTLKEWFFENYRTYMRPGLEADDCMGILATHPTLIPGDKIMVSEDKDMKTVPGLLFNPGKDKKPRKVTRRDANRAFLIQTIVGDTSDGYPGAPGVGPKSEFVKRLEAASEPTQEWHTVCAAFEKSGFAGKLPGVDPTVDGWDALARAAAVTPARLARILRASDWDFKAKRPILWNPPAKSAA